MEIGGLGFEVLGFNCWVKIMDYEPWVYNQWENWNKKKWCEKF